jgi:hypothetical protein
MSLSVRVQGGTSAGRKKPLKEKPPRWWSHKCRASGWDGAQRLERGHLTRPRTAMSPVSENCQRDVAGVMQPFGGMHVCGRADCLAAQRASLEADDNGARRARRGCWRRLTSRFPGASGIEAGPRRAGRGCTLSSARGGMSFDGVALKLRNRRISGRPDRPRPGRLSLDH